ncbi:hypothetical protein L1D53_25575, partial [Vibrio alginolyticus]|nr:hypothetical protein [Vibrio alginolyticus]
LQPKATQLHCYDTDPVNPTFSQYQALQPKVVNILTEDNNINTRFFDDLLEDLFNLDGIAVVDNGALQPKATQLHCYDTDPVNPTFSQYQALQPKVVNILTEDNNINTRFFDDLLEDLFNLDGIAVVDNGAATFVPLMAYMAENDVAEMLAENGVCLVVHIPVTGGQALSECLKGLNQTLNTMNAEIVVWLNEYNGKIEQNGKSFEQFGVYKQNQNRILGTILLESFSADTYGHDIAQMTSLNLTFDEVK